MSEISPESNDSSVEYIPPPASSKSDNGNLTETGAITGNAASSTGNTETGKKKWDDDLINTETYKIAFKFYSGRKSPSVAELRTTLASFIREPASNYFRSNASIQAKAFTSLKKDIPTYSSITSRDKIWNTNYIANKLSLIQVMHEMEMTDRKEASTRGAARENQLKNSTLMKLFKDLSTAYDTFLNEYREKSNAEQNKVLRYPSLEMQSSGAKRQQNCNWKLSKSDDVACPYCLHHPTTMAVQDERVELNANNVARATATVTGKAIVATSTYHGCYCYQFNCYGKSSGVGCHACLEKARTGVPFVPGIMPGKCQWDCELCNCTCSVAFQQHHRIHIMNSRVKALEKEKQEAGGKSSAPLMAAVTTAPQKAELGRENIMKHVNHLIQHHTFSQLEDTQLDSDTNYDAVRQNALSMTAVDITAAQGSIAYADLGLQMMFPAPSKVRKSMMPAKVPNSITSVAQAKKQILSGPGHSTTTSAATLGSTTTNHMPPRSNFISNKSTSNRVYRNGLLPEPSARANPHPADGDNIVSTPSMVERVQKRALIEWRSQYTSPDSKKVLLTIADKVSSNNTYTTAINVLNPPNSQEALSICMDITKGLGHSSG